MSARVHIVKHLWFFYLKKILIFDKQFIMIYISLTKDGTFRISSDQFSQVTIITTLVQLTEGEHIQQIILPLCFIFQCDRLACTYLEGFTRFFELLKCNDVDTDFSYLITDYEPGTSLISKLMTIWNKKFQNSKMGIDVFNLSCREFFFGHFKT